MGVEETILQAGWEVLVPAYSYVSCRSTPYNLKSNGYLHGVGQGSRVLSEPWSEWPRKKLGGYRASIHVLTQTQTVKFKLTTHGDPRTLG